jgi:peptidyl-prolyl cis-trans isomerase D
LRKQALVQAVVESAIVPKQVLERIERLLREQREVRELRFAAEQFVASVKVADAQITEFYEQNRRLFETPENVKIEYLLLSPTTIAGAGSVAEADVRAYYEQNKSRYGTEEQRRASHILISAEGSDKAAARKKAEEILAKVRAKPTDFEKLAREHSKDTGSAAQGGDLGFFGRGMMVKPFEDAAFALKEGEISNVIETDFGAHIIKLTSIKPAQAKPFDEVRADIERDLKQQEAQKRFTEAADQFTNLVYEQADSLQPAADKLKLKVQTIEALTRQGLPPLMNARVVEALFSDDSLKNKRNTQAIEVATNTLVSARVLEHRPAAVRPLDQVRSQISELLTRREAVRLAREAGEARLAELRKQPSDAGFQPARWISRQQPQGLPPAAVNQILRVPADKLPGFVGVELENAGFLIANVLSAREGVATDSAQREAQARAIAQQAAGADELAYADGLKTRHKVTVLKPELKRDAARGEVKAPPPAEKK